MRAILIVMILGATARAQAIDVAAVGDGDSVGTVTTGVEHGMVVEAGYARAARHLLVHGELALSAAGMDPHDFRVRAGALAPLWRGGRWRWLGGASAIVRGTNDDIADMIDLGVDVETLAGYYTPCWFAAAELGLDAALATHIRPTDAYRMQVYAAARDGWYPATGALLRLGLQAGHAFGRNEVAVRAGVTRDYAGDPPMIPFYATLGYDRRW